MPRTLENGIVGCVQNRILGTLAIGVKSVRILGVSSWLHRILNFRATGIARCVCFGMKIIKRLRVKEKIVTL